MTGWSITSKETESVIKNLPTNKSLGPDVFSGECYQTFKGESIPIFLKSFQKIEHFQTHFMRPALPRYQKQTRMLQDRKVTDQYP